MVLDCANSGLVVGLDYWGGGNFGFGSGESGLMVVLNY